MTLPSDQESKTDRKQYWPLLFTFFSLFFHMEREKINPSINEILWLDVIILYAFCLHVEGNR